MIRTAFATACTALATTLATAAPVTYTIEPTHTYPSFEADHLAGLSVWRGKFNKTAGTIVYDRATRDSSINITVDIDSIDFGLELMNSKARSAEFFDSAKYPTATYKGKLADFDDKGQPTTVQGELTMHGVTRPVALNILKLKCMPHPMLKREICGADATTTFQRDAFGMDLGKAYGFNMDVTLRIQVEALANE